MNRRNFLQFGAAGALTLPAVLEARAQSAATNNKSVVWLWLGGGPTHVETFDPKMTAPVEYRSVTGEVKTTIPGVTLGGNFEKMAQVAGKMAFVRSFAHTDSGHSGGTHFVMTGFDNRQSDNGGKPTHPFIGSILSRVRGANHPITGMPTFISQNGIYADGATWLGKAYEPFSITGDARRNMQLQVEMARTDDRRGLLQSLDTLKRSADQSGTMSGLDAFEQQAFNLVLGRAPRAFDLSHEDPKTRQRYGTGLGEQLLLARRLCEAGSGFVTIHFGGWDMHGQIKQNMDRLGPVVDHAVATFIEDVSQRGLLGNILLVISGEFGRTPRINGNAGRDHWAPLSTLALAGGGLTMGQVIGQSDSNATRPLTAPISPQDVMATIFHVLGIDPKIQFTNPAGRPMYMVEDGKPITELV